MNSEENVAKSPNQVAAKDESLSTRALPFRLLKLSNLISRPFFGEMAKRYSVTLNEWRTLYVLASHPGSSALEISNATGLQPMNISRALAALRKDKLISEEPDPNDLRRNLITLTPAGLNVCKEIARSAKADSEPLFSGIPADKLAVFSEVVDILISRSESILDKSK